MARAQWTRMLVKVLRGMSLHRPIKVERTRKRSEGFPPDRKVEKKKGEGLAALVAAQVLYPEAAEVGMGECSFTQAGPRPGLGVGASTSRSGPGSVFSPGHRTFRGGEASEAAQ